MIVLTEEVQREAEQLRQAIGELLNGHNPAAAADALISLLARLIARNAHDPAGMAAALGRNLVLALDDDDDGEGPLQN